MTKSNVQNETGKKSFNDEIQLFEKTQFPAMKSDSLDRERDPRGQKSKSWEPFWSYQLNSTADLANLAQI